MWSGVRVSGTLPPRESRSRLTRSRDNAAHCARRAQVRAPTARRPHLDEIRDGIKPPPLPNRTGGFPASGSPVGGYSLRRLNKRRAALTQGEQAVGVEKGIRPALMIAAPSAAVTAGALSHDSADPSACGTVDSGEGNAPAVLEVSKRALRLTLRVAAQIALMLRPSVRRVFARSASFKFSHALLTWPFHATLEVVAQEVEAPGGSHIHDLCLLPVQPQAIGLWEVLDSPQGSRASSRLSTSTTKSSA